MRLQKTLSYLEVQLKVHTLAWNAYQSWLKDKVQEKGLSLNTPSEPLLTHYAWYAHNLGEDPREELTLILESLEEVNGEVERARFNKMLADLGDQFFH